MKLIYILTVFTLASCASNKEFSHRINDSGRDIRYFSIDLARMDVFSERTARLGAPPGISAIWPSSKVHRIEIGDNLQCISVGSPGSTVEFAVKRPLKAGSEYKCLETSFRISRCFDYCKAAIIEIFRPFSGNVPGSYKASMYVDACRGVIILSAASDLAEGIPLSAQLLRGEVGILADPDYPKCRSI